MIPLTNQPQVLAGTECFLVPTEWTWRMVNRWCRDRLIIGRYFPFTYKEPCFIYVGFFDTPVLLIEYGGG